VELKLPEGSTASPRVNLEYVEKAAAPPAQPPPPVFVDQEAEYEVEQIEDSRIIRGRLQFKVKWKGYPQDFVWYNADNHEFQDARDIVEEYYQRTKTNIRKPKGWEQG
jgi:hypothetical protein